MGLLDGLQTDEGLLGLYLMAAGSAKPQRTSLGEGLLGAFQMQQQQKAAREDREMKKQQFDMQRQQQQIALQQLQQQLQEQAAQKAWRESIPAPQGQPLPAGPYMGGAKDSQAANVPPPTAVDPMQQAMYSGMRAGAVNPLQYLQMQQKDTSPIKLSKGEKMYGRDGRLLFGNEDTPDLPSAVREYQFAKTQGYPGTFEQWSREQANLKAPKTTVQVNTGQKGFDNTLKLRGDFRSEPVYKAHQEMQSAYSQIQQSLKQQSPAGDLAGATKIMKLLDPGSVVRESELGMAMAASGLLDRVQNYASSVINGTKLTPTQRQDFQRLADALYGESVKQYNGKRSEYQGIAERNQLSVPDVLGAESSMPVQSGGWSIKPKGQ